jgi:hypothetical protein
MKYISYMTIGTGLIVLLAGCGGLTSDTDSTSDSSSSDESSSTNITNAILTSKSANCEDYVNSYSSSVTDIQNDTDYEGALTIEVSNGKCIFDSNMIPNHDFNDASANFFTAASEQSSSVEITTSPSFASSNTDLELSANGIYLNGVSLDLLAAGCYGVASGQIGCHDLDQPFRSDPMHNRGFGVDIHNAHVQPGGKYHYHGSPVALFDTTGSVESPVIGFAKDGFPIFGSYISTGGTVKKVTPSYVLKSGSRAAITFDGTTYDPGGTYDGTYKDDWEYTAGSGDLDECNGMTADGVYGYYVTDAYPWVMGCYKGTPDSSFAQ